MIEELSLFLAGILLFVCLMIIFCAVLGIILVIHALSEHIEIQIEKRKNLK